MTALIFLTALWLSPALVAFGRGVRGRTVTSIALVCLLLGWTLIGWVLALIWSLEAPRDA